MIYISPSSIHPGDVLLRVFGHTELCRLDHISRNDRGEATYHFSGFSIHEAALLKFFKTSPDGKSLEVI